MYFTSFFQRYHLVALPKIRPWNSYFNNYEMILQKSVKNTFVSGLPMIKALSLYKIKRWNRTIPNIPDIWLQ